MQTYKTRWQENTRILWAITAKDLLQALKSKNTLFLIVFGILMVGFYAKYPALIYRGEPPSVLFYDEGNSALAAYLENSPALEAYKYRSAEQMKEYLAHGDVPELGLVIPTGFDQSVESGSEPVLQGYIMHWVSSADAGRLQSTAEAEISRLVGVPVRLEIQGNVVYPAPDSGGMGVNAAIGFVYIITTLGLVLVPHLFLEEKLAHTLDALLVTPASEGQVVLAKALTGLFYCLFGAGMTLGFFHPLVVHWWLAIFVMLVGSLFTVSIGLLLGTFIENRGQLSLLAWIFILPLMLPAFLTLLDDLLPAAAVQIFRAIPSTVIFNLLRTSFSADATPGPALLELAWVGAWAAGFLLGVAWLIRRRDRAEEGTPALQGLADTARDSLRGFVLRFLRNQDRSLERTEPATRLMDEAQPVHSEPVLASGLPAGLRIILAIAAKDIGTAIKNKVVVSILLGTVMVIANGSILPLLLGLGNKPSAVAFDEGSSTILRGLAVREDIRLSIVESWEEMEEAISGASETRLGLVIPANFDQRAGGQAIELEGHLAHWADTDKSSQWVAVFEHELSQATWGIVQINLAERPLYPTVNTGGHLSLTTLLMMIVIMTVGVSLVPLLFVEEKESKTFDILLISPAGLAQVLAGKALAGGFYCLVAALVVLLLNHYLVVHWGVALLAVMLGSTITVALGLVVGLLSDTPATTGVWGGILLVVLFVLTGLSALAEQTWPAFVRVTLDWLPGSSLLELTRLALVGEIPPGLVWTNAAALFVAAGLIFAVLLGLLRRADR